MLTPLLRGLPLDGGDTGETKKKEKKVHSKCGRHSPVTMAATAPRRCLLVLLIKNKSALLVLRRNPWMTMI